jgi:hypothetical protein
MIPVQETASGRFQDELDSIDEVVEVLVKGHLLIEAAITRIVEMHLRHPEFLSDASLRFYQKSTIARSFFPGEDALSDWHLIHAVNALRSTLSHALRSAERDKRVARVRRTFFKEAPDGPLKESLRDASDAQVIAAACAHCMAFLSGFESEARRIRKIDSTTTGLNPS